MSEYIAHLMYCVEKNILNARAFRKSLDDKSPIVEFIYGYDVIGKVG